MGRRDYEKILDSQIKHLSFSSQNLMDEFHEHSSLHVAEYIFSVYLFTKLVSAIYSNTISTQTAWGAPECILSFLKCCTVLSTYASQNPTLCFALPHIFNI